MIRYRLDSNIVSEPALERPNESVRRDVPFRKVLCSQEYRRRWDHACGVLLACLTYLFNKPSLTKRGLT